MFGANAFGSIYFGGAWLQYYFADTDSFTLSEDVANIYQLLSDSASLSEATPNIYQLLADGATLSEIFAVTNELLIDSDSFALTDSERLTIQLIVGARSRNWFPKRVDDEELLEILSIVE